MEYVRANRPNISCKSLDRDGGSCLGSVSVREGCKPSISGSRGKNNLTSVEIESILGNEELAVLLEAAGIRETEDLPGLLEAPEEGGQLRQPKLNELVEPMELEPLELEAIYQE